MLNLRCGPFTMHLSWKEATKGSPFSKEGEGEQMLILTRRCGESITIGDDIRVRVLGIKGAQVRLGIEAPQDVPIHREEILRKRMGKEDV